MVAIDPPEEIKEVVSSFSVVTLEKEVTFLEFFNIGNIPFSSHALAAANSATINLFIETKTPVEVRALFKERVIAIHKNINQSGIYRVPMDKPNEDGVIFIQAKKKESGIDPIIYACQVEFEK